MGMQVVVEHAERDLKKTGCREDSVMERETVLDYS
jgi:hypothetical protein